MEQLKSWEKIRNVFLVVVLVFGAASLTFAIARMISNPQGITPNAPESKPRAGGPTTPPPCGAGLYCVDPSLGQPTGSSLCTATVGNEMRNQWCCLAGKKLINGNTACESSSGGGGSAGGGSGGNGGGTTTATKPAKKKKTTATTCPEAEQCPDDNNVLKSCDEPEPGGGTADSLCLWDRRVEKCGGKDYCCPKKGQKWTADMTKCAKPTPTATPSATPTLSPTITPPTCTETTWTPDPSTVCLTASFEQTGNCGTKRSTSGTKNCCVDSTWSPNQASACSTDKVFQTSNCGNGREVDGTKTCYPELDIQVKAYRNKEKTSGGDFQFGETIYNAERGQEFLYAMEIKNTGNGRGSNLVLTDTLTGQNQDLIVFLEADKRCNFDHTTKTVRCQISKLEPGAKEQYGFKVRVDDKATNGRIIRNTAKLLYGGKTKDSSVTVALSSVVDCNERCSSNKECSKGLACDSSSSKCRKPICTKETSCACPVVTPKLTATPTRIPTEVVPTEAAPTEIVVDEAEVTKEVTDALTSSPVQEELPETGILDLPGAVTFGGGLVLAVLGILLAL